MEKSILTGPANLFFFARHENPRNSVFFWGFSLFSKPPYSLLILAQSCRRSSLHLNVFFLSLNFESWQFEHRLNTLYLKRGHKLLEAFARLKWGQNWKSPILESHKSDRSRSIRNYQGRKQITPLSPDSFSTNVLFSRQNGDICGTTGIWQENWRHFKVGVFCGGVQGSSCAHHE